MRALDCVTAPRLKSTESTEEFTAKIDTSEACISEAQRRDVESHFSKSNAGGARHSTWWTLGIDIPLLVLAMRQVNVTARYRSGIISDGVLALVVISLALFELGVVPQHKAGFYCNDPKLAFPFNGESVSAAFLISTIICLPLVVIFPCEVIFLETDYNRSRVYQAIRNTLWLFRCYAYGLFMNLGIVEVMKTITGSPRPTFFDICEPDNGKTCQGSEYVSTYKCTSTRFGEWMQMDAHHSFPSGHTSLSVYCALFLAWYLQRRAFDWRHRSIFLVPVIQLCLATYAAVCSLTRISDHRHHWWDVTVGAIVGVATMLYAVLVLCGNFTSKKKNSESQQCLYNGRNQVPLA